jgi:c(7)-type cytochrome triheme protein
LKGLIVAAAALVLGLCLSPGEAGAPPADRPTFGFDHLVHAGQVSVAGKAALPCTRCHTMTARGQLRGRPDHRTCFGACHGKAPKSARLPGPKKLSKRNQRICARCHSPTAVARYTRGARARLGVRYPPYTAERDFGIGFSHKHHDGPSRAKGASPSGCRSCHSEPDANAKVKRLVAHGRCTGCHLAPKTRAIPAMTKCTSCHKAAYGPATDPHLVSGAYPVTRAFSHRGHRRHTPKLEDCRTCHANVAATDKIELAAPPASACASCHDGSKAFSVLEPACRRCHQQRGPKSLRPKVPRKRFSHSAHRGRGMRMACSSCHTLDGGGDPRSAARKHAPCSDSGCHRKEFGALRPNICGACHVSIEPWRPLHHDRSPRLGTEFGAVFSHKAHLGGSSPRARTACSHCHRRKRGLRDLALPRNHDACSGSGCHRATAPTRAGVARPTLAQCQACHSRDLITNREKQRRTANFSVRSSFRHKGHLATAKGGKVPCATCHRRVTSATALSDVPTPTKSTCASCHNGRAAFKVTGHGCYKCHSR